MAAQDAGLAAVARGVRLQEVHKSFRRENGQLIKVLDGVSFDALPSSITCVLGPSGCGKSTLLNIVAGLDRPDAGTVEYGDRSTQSKVQVGYVFQSPRLLPWRTVRQNLELALKAAGVPQTEWKERVERYLTLVGLIEFANQYPLYLSGGMQQRVGLARAFAIEPALVLMDEPFASVDELTAVRLREEVQRLNRTLGRTTLFVTHNMHEAAFLGDQVVLLSKRPTTVTEVWHNPADKRLWGDPNQFQSARELDRIIRGGDHTGG